eukprot:6347845-Amphidinium_carterae.2
MVSAAFWFDGCSNNKCPHYGILPQGSACLFATSSSAKYIESSVCSRWDGTCSKWLVLNAPDSSILGIFWPQRSMSIEKWASLGKSKQVLHSERLASCKMLVESRSLLHGNMCYCFQCALVLDDYRDCCMQVDKERYTMMHVLHEFLTQHDVEVATRFARQSENFSGLTQKSQNAQGSSNFLNICRLPSTKVSCCEEILLQIWVLTRRLA